MDWRHRAAGAVNAATTDPDTTNGAPPVWAGPRLESL